MNIEKLVLGSAGISIAAIGLGYLVAPASLYGLYGIDIVSTNAFNMVRGAYGGLFLGFGLLFLMGARQSNYAHAALLALFTFMAGFALGRLSGLLMEGVPSFLILGLLVSELFYAIASWLLLSKRRSLRRTGLHH